MRQLSLNASPWSKREVLETPAKVRVAMVLSALSLDAVQLHLQVVDVGGLEAVAQAGALAA